MNSTSDFSAPRLFVESPLKAGLDYLCPAGQGHYLRTVLRLKKGDHILLFNGQEGEWQARLDVVQKKKCTLKIVTQMRPQEPPGNIHYLFAPLKHARLDYMVQKATEMGVSLLQPTITKRTQVRRLNLARMRANVIEAAEQCGCLTLAEIAEPQSLDERLRSWPQGRHLIYCDEQAEPGSPLDALQAVRDKPLSILIGPEGGFDDEECQQLRALPFVTAISLGTRIIRADTAAVAALALVNASLR